MNLGKILSEAWRIVWKHKVLWLLGILASCSASGSGLNNLFNVARTGPENSVSLPPALRWQLLQFFQHSENYLGVIITLLTLLCLLGLVLLALSVLGQLGIVRGTLNALDGAESLSLRELLREIQPAFWPFWGLEAALSLLGGLVGVVFGLGLAFSLATTAGLLLLCLLPLFCLLLPIGFVFTSVLNYGLVAILDEGHGLIQGLERGWAVFRAYWSQTLALWLTLTGIGLAAGMVIGLPSLLALFILFLPETLLTASSRFWLAFGYTASLIPFLLAAYGLIAAYAGAAWTAAYRQLTAAPVAAEEGNISQPA